MQKTMRPSVLGLILIGLMATLACGGKTGTLASSGTSSSAAAVGVSVTPKTSAINTGQTLQFTAAVSGTTNTGITWQVNGISGGKSTVGTISTAGLYSTPSTVPSGGSVTVTAISVADTSKTASASIVIAAAATPVTVTISPASVSLSGGQTKQFTTTVSGTTNTGVTWQVDGVTGGSSATGTISTSGLYTAPVVSSSTAVTITARSSYESTQSANAAANIAASSAPAPQTSGPALYVAITGSDGYACTSTAPCATIARASALATPGTTIHVAPGTYNGDFVTRTSGTASAHITYLSDTRWGAKLVGSSSGIVWELDASYVDVNGFDIAGGSGDSFGIYIGWSGSGYGHNQILNNHIHDFTSGCNSTGGAGIETGELQAGYNTINANVVANMMVSQVGGTCYTVQGIYIDTAHDLVTNNLVYGVAEGGIQQWHGATASTIVNNTVFHCNEGIILGDGDSGAGSSSNNFVANNISVYNQVGIDEMGTMGSGNSYVDNLVYSNSSSNLIISTATPTGTLTSNPLFVNYQANGTGDYHLASGSPAIKAGASTNAPATDFAGTAQTAPPSIGAYAYPL